MLMNMLSLTSIPSNPAGKRMIVEMMGKMVDFEKSFAAEDEEAVNRLVKCYSAASDYFSVRKVKKFRPFLDCIKQRENQEFKKIQANLFQNLRNHELKTNIFLKNR